MHKKRTKTLLFTSKEIDNSLGAGLAEALEVGDLLLQFVHLGPQALKLERGPDRLGVESVELFVDVVHLLLHVADPRLDVEDGPHQHLDPLREVEDVPVRLGKGFRALRLDRVGGELLGGRLDLVLVGVPLVRPPLDILRRLFDGRIGCGRLLNVKRQR